MMRHLATSFAPARRIVIASPLLYQPRVGRQAGVYSSHHVSQEGGLPRWSSFVAARQKIQCRGRQQQQQQQSSTPSRAVTYTGASQQYRHYRSSEVDEAEGEAAAGEGERQPIQLQTTCLTELHMANGAKMVPFAGFNMPVVYTGQTVSESHAWTRQQASLFDVSHMVQQTFRGPKAGWFLERVTTCAAQTMPLGTSALSALLREETGGMVDDCVVARVGEMEWYIVTNAGRRHEDEEFIRDRLVGMGFTNTEDVLWGRGDGLGMVAIQGPHAKDVVEKCLSLDSGILWDEFWFGSVGIATFDLGEGQTTKVMVSRGGYTGEDGFEIGMMNPEVAGVMVEILLQKGSGRLRLAGLGARDSLRLEAGMCLYGHDLDETVTPVEAGLSWIIPKQRRDENSMPPFPGKTRILDQLRSKANGGLGVDKRRVGLVIEKGAPAREGAEIVMAVSKKGQEGQEEEEETETVGVVTSGCPSPTTGKNVAMAYVNDGLHKLGTELEVLVRGRRRKAVVTKMPFVESRYYKRPT